LQRSITREGTLTPDELESYLHEHIPISGHMGIRVRRVDLRAVTLGAPLEPNINHRSTVFGGSCASVAMLAAWSLVLLRVRGAGLDARIVIQRGSVDYLTPIDDEFTATCRSPEDSNWQRLVRTLERGRPARIQLAAEVESAGRLVARFEGGFAALPFSDRSTGDTASGQSQFI
jgi:thioesterase domain-containing protein